MIDSQGLSVLQAMPLKKKYSISLKLFFGSSFEPSKEVLLKVMSVAEPFVKNTMIVVNTCHGIRADFSSFQNID